MIYVIEEGAIASNHKDSAVAKWLEERGFALKNPEDMWHRVGPWIFVDDEEMYYRYCPHFGTGPSDVFADVHFRFEEFKAICTAVMSARARKAQASAVARPCPSGRRRKYLIWYNSLVGAVAQLDGCA